MTGMVQPPLGGGGSAAALRRARDRFRARAVRDAHEMAALAAAGGAAAPARIRELAHGLAGAGGAFGAPALGELALAAERAALAAMADPCEGFHALSRAVAAVCAEASAEAARGGDG